MLISHFYTYKAQIESIDSHINICTENGKLYPERKSNTNILYDPDYVDTVEPRYNGL